MWHIVSKYMTTSSTTQYKYSVLFYAMQKWKANAHILTLFVSLLPQSQHLGDLHKLFLKLVNRYIMNPSFSSYVLIPAKVMMSDGDKDTTRME